MAMNADYKALFLEECQTQLKEWEDSLLALEHAPDDADQLRRLLRALHTLKGSAGFVECTELQSLTHLLESAIVGDRGEEPRLDPGMTNLLFDGLDGARAVIDAFAADSPAGDAARGIKARLEKLLAAPGVAATTPAKGRLFRIGIHIEAPSQEKYLRALLVQTRLEEIGTIVAVSPTLEELRMQDAEFEYSVVIETEKSEDDLAAALSIDQVAVREIRPHVHGETGGDRPRAGAADDGERGAQRRGNIVRVPASKLDAMLNLVGELVVQNSGFMSLAREMRTLHRGSPLVARLEEKTGMLARIARELQAEVMKVRMLPAATVFSRFPRVVRDLSKSTGKEIRLEIAGGETEIDKKVIDRISEPLVHLVRNAADHGIERGEERRALGKDPTGVIRMSAYQSGDRICVEVADDGRGLDRQRIIAKAVQRGLVDPREAARLSEEEISSFIFLPGFSTSETVSDISGRGVGLDVVREFVEEMNGSVRVRSVPGLSTTITITLPLTMAIIRALLVESSRLLYAIPISAVREVVEASPESGTRIDDGPAIRVRDEILPVVPLAALLSDAPDDLPDPDAQPDAGPVIVTHHPRHRVGIRVSSVLGSAEVVVKSLGRHYREVEGLLGASILGNGKMAVILDIGALLDMRFAGAAADRPRDGAESPAAELPALPAPPPDPRLEEVFSSGALAASRALTDMLGEEIRVTFPELQFVPLAEVASRLGGDDEPVVRIYVDLKEGIVGGHLVVVPMARALPLSDALLGRDRGTTAAIGEDELSTFSELGNILSASFLNSLADRLGISINSEVPDVRVDMCLPTIDAVLARFQEPGSHILLTTTEVFAGESEEAVCHMLLFLERQSLELLHDALGARTGADG